MPSIVVLLLCVHLCPFPYSQQGTLHKRFCDFDQILTAADHITGPFLSNYAIKKAVEDLMDYAHSNIQSIPLSHLKVTRTGSTHLSIGVDDRVAKG